MSAWVENTPRERCLITHNLCGTDTRPVGNPCPCWHCCIAAARAEGRAAGFAEAIEKAAKELESAAALIHPELQLHERYDAIKKFALAKASRIRTLAPAGKETK